MMNLMGALALSYLAGSGTVTNTTVVGRGLFRSAKKAIQGQYTEAGVEALAALATPALMTYASTAALVMDVVAAAAELSQPTLEDVEVALPIRRKRVA